MTGTSPDIDDKPSNFNSHPHEEDDWGEGHPTWEQENFNSHPHEEDDTVPRNLQILHRHFNSHPHEEDD